MSTTSTHSKIVKILRYIFIFILIVIGIFVAVIVATIIKSNHYDSNPSHTEGTTTNSVYGYKSPQELNENYPMNKTVSDVETATVNFTKNNATSFVNYINGIDSNYNYSNLYDFEKPLEKYNVVINTTLHHNDNYELTVDNLFKIVKENNDKYINDKQINAFLYDEISDADIKTTCSAIVNVFNHYIDNGLINESEAKCTLSDLKIFKQESSTALAFVSSKNCLILNPNMADIQSIFIKEKSDTYVLTHEIIHLMQKGCNCYSKDCPDLVQMFGSNCTFNNVPVNTIKFSWLYEASAEKEMANYTNHPTTTYHAYITYLESLNLANLKDFNIEKLSFNHDINALYNYYNLTSDKDKTELLNMLYYIEIMQVAPDDFYEAYGKPKPSDDVKENVCYTVKPVIFETLTKLFYKNLSETITDKEIPIQDVFYLISLFENDVNSHLEYSNPDLNKYNNDFLKVYTEIQNQFFLELANASNLSKEQVYEKFDNYGAFIKDGDSKKDNFKLDFLSTGQINYLKGRQEALQSSASISVREHFLSTQ